LNITHYYWKKLLLNGFPFIKIELLRDNPLNIDIRNWKEIISSVSNYPIEIIENHLKRIRKGCQ
jgi:lipopolysaccharide biosynthesis protein